MNCTLYTVSDDKRVISKTLGTGVTVQCHVYDGCDIVQPRILIDYDSSLTTCNYMYIDDFHRYYYIDNIRFDAGQRMILEVSVDVLYTYKDEIKAIMATCVRNEYAPEALIVDRFTTFTPRREVEIYPINKTPFNIRNAPNDSANYVLCCGGGMVAG